MLPDPLRQTYLLRTKATRNNYEQKLNTVKNKKTYLYNTFNLGSIISKIVEVHVRKKNETKATNQTTWNE